MRTKIKTLAELAMCSVLFTGLIYGIFGLYAIKVGHPIW